MRKRAKHLHHRSIAAEREHRVIVMRVGVGERGRVSGGLRLHQMALDSRVGKSLHRLGADPQSSSRGGVHDQQHALDSPWSDSRRRRRAHATSRLFLTCIAKLSAVNDC